MSAPAHGSKAAPSLRPADQEHLITALRNVADDLRELLWYARLTAKDDSENVDLGVAYRQYLDWLAAVEAAAIHLCPARLLPPEVSTFQSGVDERNALTTLLSWVNVVITDYSPNEAVPDRRTVTPEIQEGATSTPTSGIAGTQDAKVKSECSLPQRSDAEDISVEKPAKRSIDAPPHPDGPEAARWLWWKARRHALPSGTIGRLIAHMWAREYAYFDELTSHEVFESDVSDKSFKGRASDASQVLKKIGVPWRLSVW